MANGNIEQERHDFYVYVIFRPNGIPCYVGKGTGKRWSKSPLWRNNSHLRRIWETAGRDLPIAIVRENISEHDAFETEIAFIAAIGRSDKQEGPLVNFTDGGCGPLGHKISIETIRRISAKNRGRKRTPETCAKISAAKIGVPRPDLRGKPIPEEIRQKISEAQKGKPRPKASPETRLKMSLARRGVKRGPPSEETRQKISKSNRGKRLGIPKSEETKARMRKPKSEAWRLAIAHAIRRRFGKDLT